MTTHLYLIRHGESTWNEAGRVQGVGNPALSRCGWAQARAVARRLGGVPLQRIYTSPLARAMQTACVIRDHVKAPLVPVADFREVGFGVWEGMPVRRLHRCWPALYTTWLRTPSRARIPQGEGIGPFQRRVLAAFRGVLDDADGGVTVAIVTHGGVIRVILARVLGVPFDPLMRGISLGNTSVTQLTWTRGRLAVTVLNDTTHLTNPVNR